MKIKTFCGGYDSNFCYVVYDSNSKKCCILDPSVPAQEVLTWIEKESLTTEFVVMMHSHFDHLIGLEVYRKKMIPVYGHESTTIEVDKKLKDQEIFGFSNLSFKVLHTPGHLYDAICLLLNEKYLFTSDTLFVGCCGRTDLEGSDVKEMKSSLKKLSLLSEEIIIYPGHDYGSTSTSTIGREKQNNKFLQN